MMCGPCSMLQSSKLCYVTGQCPTHFSIQLNKINFGMKNLVYSFNGESMTIYSILYYIHVESAVVIGTRKHFEVTNMYKLFLS